MKGLNALQTSRIWMLFASLATRGAGFLTSLLIARLMGASALGAYSALSNTATLVATPFASVLGNNSTLLGTVGSRDGAKNYRLHARASLVLAVVLSTLSAAALILLYVFVIDGEASQSPLLLSTGVAVVVGQVVGAVSIGFLYGAGEFVLASRISVLIALVVSVLVYPVILHYGLHGALVLLLISSLVPPVIMGAAVLGKGGSLPEATVVPSEAWQEVGLRFARAWPSIVVVAANSGAHWVCTIYLVHSVYGSAGVGVVAVATQWLNLMLIPATSWGGVSLKIISDAVASGDQRAAWRAAVDLTRKNLLVTLVLAGSFAFASGVIARAYGLSDTDVALLICVNAAGALVSAVNNIFERFLLALDRQAWWLAFSLVSYLAQAIVTSLFIARGLWVVAMGVLVASIILCLLSYVGVSRALPLQMKEQK